MTDGNPDSLAAETAARAIAAGRFAEAYLALDFPGPRASAATPGSWRWGAQLARARLLTRLGAVNAARTVLPLPVPATANTWAEAAWQLTYAVLERTTGRPQAALKAARRAAQLLVRLTPPTHPLRAHGWYELASAHNIGGEVDSAIYYAARALQPAADSPHPTPRWATGLAARLAFSPLTALPVYTLMAHALIQRRDSGAVHVGRRTFASRTAAAGVFLDSAARYSQRPDVDDLQLAGLWRGWGLYWADRALATEDEAAARNAARRADSSLARAVKLARSPTDRVTAEIMRGEVAGGVYGPLAALPIYQRAMRDLLGPAGRPGNLKAAANTSAEITTDSAGLPPAFSAVAGQNALFYLLEQQAATYRDLYAETAKSGDLDHFFTTAIQLTAVLAYRREQARRGYAAETPGVDAATVTDNYALGVEAAEARFRRHRQPADLALAFRITQNAKAWRLLTRVGGERATAGLRADDTLFTGYQRAAGALRRWEELTTLGQKYPVMRVADGIGVAPDSAQAARRALMTITGALQRRYPALYARALNGSYALPLPQAQASLPADGHTAAIEFLRRTSLEDGSHQEAVYAFVVQRTSTRLLRLALPPDFPSLVDSLVEALARPGSPTYPALAARVYALVMAPVVQTLAPGVRHLIVAPDGELWRLPFEALLTRPLTAAEARGVDYRRLPYALRRWTFTYAHSLTLRARARAGATPAHLAPARMLALAPFSDPARDQALPFSGRLLTQLARTTGGDFFTGMAASRTALQRGAARADVLHLATHATADLADPTASALTLADGPFPLADLFSLPLRPRLVVLSACQTGVGRIGGPSESATSLSWGFTYAGAGSTLATLWRVDDAATATVLGRFYQHLLAHAPKNTALHRAKLAALDSARTAASADPFYWAGLVLTGDERALTLAPPAAPLRSHPARGVLIGALAGAILLVLGTGIWWWRRTASQRT
ncbi:MAG: CHAT domain-containing protein [Hymenobacteraceae bacterium]|nr:CHAT domain-containing protein [Hymenobacteraceae bacterium]